VGAVKAVRSVHILMIYNKECYKYITKIYNIIDPTRRAPARTPCGDGRDLEL
jgi:hypothetical protein